ncbi:MAG: hypothetical protein NDJ92_04920 [Thermoanaerobaculia bacterium]|nr:hypothetical protein [Thermoanaerobaculia bacterium]
MGTTEKPVPRRTLSGTKNPQAAAQTKVVDEAISAGKSYARDKLFENRPYLKFAFANPYNISTLLGGLAIGGMALGPVGVAGVLAAEALWLLWAPSSKRLQHILWDPRFEKVRDAIEAQEREKKTRDLPAYLKERVASLVEKRQRIHHLAEQNPSFGSELLKGELVKTSRLVDSFIDMAIRCTRYEQYLESIDLRDLERDRQRWETRMRTGKEGETDTDIAKKNYAIILKRLDKIREIREYLSVARGQLDLIENSFKLIADQIVTMQSPGELVGQLDELMTGVEAIQESARDTEKMLQAMEM